MLNVNILSLLLVLSIGACSSTRYPNVASEPLGATLYTSSNEEIGKTPLELNSDILKKLRVEDSNIFSLKAGMDGYESVQIYFEPRAAEKIRLNLRPRDSATFQQQITKDYSEDTHQMLAQFLKTQALLQSRQVVKASQNVDLLLKEYPHVSTSYVMAANLAFQKKDLVSARNYLIQAYRKSPKDPDIRSGLEKLGVKP